MAPLSIREAASPRVECQTEESAFVRKSHVFEPLWKWEVRELAFLKVSAGLPHLTNDASEICERLRLKQTPVRVEQEDEPCLCRHVDVCVVSRTKGSCSGHIEQVFAGVSDGTEIFQVHRGGPQHGHQSTIPCMNDMVASTRK